jgi:RNA polymerase sigma-70 factor (ECF subfamily)
LDANVIRTAQSGDRDAFGRIAAELGRPFLAVANRILRDIALAEDATQEALLQVWHDIPKLHDPARFDGWAYRILVRACYAEAGRVRRRTPNLRSLQLDARDSSDDIEGVATRDELDRAFRRLSIEHRTVVVLRYYLDLPLERIADVLGIPEGTAASRLHHAIQGLRAALEADARPASREAMR